MSETDQENQEQEPIEFEGDSEIIIDPETQRLIEAKRMFQAKIEEDIRTILQVLVNVSGNKGNYVLDPGGGKLVRVD